MASETLLSVYPKPMHWVSPGAVRRLEAHVGRCGERSAQDCRCHLQVPRLDAESQSPDRPLELARATGGQKQKL